MKLLASALNSNPGVNIVNDLSNILKRFLNAKKSSILGAEGAILQTLSSRQKSLYLNKLV